MVKNISSSRLLALLTVWGSRKMFFVQAWHFFLSSLFSFNVVHYVREYSWRFVLCALQRKCVNCSLTMVWSTFGVVWLKWILLDLTWHCTSLSCYSSKLCCCWLVHDRHLSLDPCYRVTTVIETTEVYVNLYIKRRTLQSAWNHAKALLVRFVIAKYAVHAFGVLAPCIVNVYVSLCT